MPNYSFRALLCGVLLVPLAWIGIALVEKLHGSGALLPVMLIWAALVAADLTFAVRNLRRSRQHRLERTPEPRLGRR